RGDRHIRGVLRGASGRHRTDLRAVRDHGGGGRGRDRPGDRDPDLPQPRVDQRGRGEPPQVVTPNWFVTHAYLIMILPFVSAALTLFFGKRTPGKGPIYGILAIGTAFLLALGVIANFVQGGGTHEAFVHWLQIGPLEM